MHDSAQISLNTARHLVLYDHTCAFCRSQIARLQALDEQRCFEFLPNDDPKAMQRLQNLNRTALDRAIHLIHPDGRIDQGAEAMYQVARRIPRLRRWTWLYHIPGGKTVAKIAYRFIAKHRHALRPKTNSPTKH